MVQSHKAKLKNKTIYDTFRCPQNPGTPEGHRSITSHFNVKNEFGEKVSKKGDVDNDKHIDTVKIPF